MVGLKLNSQLPQEEDGQIVVTNGNGFFEIIWYCKEEDSYKKPCAYDEDDTPAFRDGRFTHWKKITPPKEYKTQKQ